MSYKYSKNVMLCMARTMLSQDVRPSVTRRYSVETAKRIRKRFSPSGSHTILVFPNQTVWQRGRRMQRGGG